MREREINRTVAHCGHKEAPRMPEPCGPDCELRWSQWSAVRFEASHPIAAALDISAGARSGTKLLPPEGACEGGEDKAFRSMCAPTIDWMQRHNNETRGRRALFFEYRGGKNALGWGHTLTAAYALHGICRLLRRFCYVSIYDMDLGVFYGYADGSSWAKPEPTELAQYLSVSTIQATRSVTFSREGLAGLLSELRNGKHAQASLIHVVQEPPLYLETGGDAWFPRLMPLRAPAASSDAPPALDRCFCRYVTQPRFSQAASTRFDVAYHLRTGFADIKASALVPRIQRSTFRTKSEFRAAYQVAERLRGSEATRWLHAACGAAGIATLSSQRAVVLSDSPGLMRLLHLRYNATVGGAREVHGSTRSFTGATNAAKLATARDIWLAGLASEMQELWTSSFARPVVARSMCIRRRRLLTGPHGACSNFSRVFIRDLPRYLPEGRTPTFYSCLHWPPQHPCSKGTAKRCEANFVAANS